MFYKVGEKRERRTAEILQLGIVKLVKLLRNIAE